MDIPELQFAVKREEDGGYVASCRLPGHGLHTQADTLEELHSNLQEVVELYLDALADELNDAAPTEARIALHFLEPVGRAA